jgi:hypothetical protein
MMEEEEQERLPVPYEQEKVLKDKYNAAMKRGDREASKLHKASLVAFYVMYGESYKGSDRPEPTSAKLCLRRALGLQHDHSVANYRYAHLLYGEKHFALAAYHFKLALDGSREQSLNDTQSLIAHIFTVNCGLLMARDAIREVDDLQNSEHASFDSKLMEDYANRMLVDSEEMLAHFLYMKVTASGNEPVSEQRFYELQEEAGDSDVLLCVTPLSRELIYRGRRERLTQTEFYVAHTVLQSKEFIQVKDIYEKLFEGRPLEEVVAPSAVRQCLRRLSRDVPFWEMVVEADIRGNFSARRLRKGIAYTLLCHSSVVLPEEKMSGA